jgi:hypothetical protein
LSLFERAENGIFLAQNLLDRRGRGNPQWLEFAKVKKANYLVNVSTRQHDSGNRRIARRSFRLKLRIGKNLCPEIGRSINQAPWPARCANGDLRLGASMSVKIACAQAGTV